MVVDTSAMVAILLAEPEAVSFAERLADAGGAVMSAAAYVELRIIARSRGRRGEAQVDELLMDCGIDVLPVTVAQARIAAAAHERFGKGRHPAGLNFGDCFAYALARERGERLLFKGGDFARTDIEAA
ncbi:MAG TPA: type II toxin-antitoxin system VapC family toxin [Geminicoccaceae bacterium]|nr:type II toxin-antitoxin system VapC family toxin [Geminicoccaceae bacterium]